MTMRNYNIENVDKSLEIYAITLNVGNMEFIRIEVSSLEKANNIGKTWVEAKMDGINQLFQSEKQLP